MNPNVISAVVRFNIRPLNEISKPVFPFISTLAYLQTKVPYLSRAVDSMEIYEKSRPTKNIASEGKYVCQQKIKMI